MLTDGEEMRLTGSMSTSDPSDDEQDIADTGMFKRFVEHEAEMDQSDSAAGSRGRVLAIAAIVAIIVIAVIVFIVTR